MSDQYVFELQFINKETPTGSEVKDNQFVIIDGSSMADFSKLKEDLGMCMPEPFTVQYIDDDDDIIPISSEEEFREFAKIAKKHSARGMLMRLILNPNALEDHGNHNATNPPVCTNCIASLNEIVQQHHPARSSKHQDSAKSSRNLRVVEKFKERIKAELKNELLSELKEEMGPSSQASAASMTKNNPGVTTDSGKEICRMEEEPKEAEYEEDSDGNMFLVYLPEKKKGKHLHYQKRLEKKEKLVEAKIDQRLEKLELKRKKLMEKYSCHHKQLIRKPAIDPKILPMIVSAIATKESAEMTKRVTPSKMFTHVWTIVNDGTLPLYNVELRHTWSSPGLEPEEAVVKLVHLQPGQEGSVAVRFRSPKTYNCSFISYWHFYRLVESVWQEFGHYVSVTGSTKPAKSSPYEFPSKVFESNKKPKQDQKAVSFIDTMDTMTIKTETTSPKETQKEEKVLNEESQSNITLKKQMEQLQATLASSEIAAEMAREAARLLAMATASAEGNTASPSHTVPKPSEGDKLSVCGMEEAATLGVQQLNLVDSESDTDANMETNEDPDRGFVIVNLTLGQPTEEQGSQVTKEDVKENTNTAVPPVSNNSTEEAQAQPEPLSFPRLDPNINYPVFPPPPPRVANGPMYLPHSPMIPNTVFNPGCQTVNYPVFPPAQNASSHGIVFPPPLLTMAPAKLTPAVNYSQIPTYPPMPTFQPAVPIPLSTQPTFVTQPPQMAPQPTQNLGPPINFSPLFNQSTVTLPRTVGSSDIPNNQNDKTFWTPAYNHTPETSVGNNSTTTPADTGVQVLITTAQTENPAATSPSAETTQSQRQPQQHTEANEQNKSSEPVQILPQALVDGAINVAATAYSTAWNALHNLRTKEGEASEFDPVFENNMAILVEMGFNNLERNARLLKRFNNDISQVIGIICSTGGGTHNLDID